MEPVAAHLRAHSMACGYRRDTYGCSPQQQWLQAADLRVPHLGAEAGVVRWGEHDGRGELPALEDVEEALEQPRRCRLAEGYYRGGYYRAEDKWAEDKRAEAAQAIVRWRGGPGGPGGLVRCCACDHRQWGL